MFVRGLSRVKYSLRPCGDRDTDSDREISRSIYPEYRDEPLHPAWFPAQQLGAPRDWVSRFNAVEAETGSNVAYATLWELRPTRFRFDLAVRPEWQRQGIGAQLFGSVLADAERFGATGLQARIRHDKSEALEFISRRGFRESHRMGAYRLDFAEARGSFFQDAFTRLRDRGIEVTHVAAVRAQDPYYVERFFDLYSAAREGWPDPDPDPTGTTDFSIRDVRHWLEDARLAEAFFIARNAGAYIAFTSFFNIGTAVHPAFRHQASQLCSKPDRSPMRNVEAFTGRPLQPPVRACKRSWSGLATCDCGAKYV
jgi:GNAT superfamily N-acetyltransferase